MKFRLRNPTQPTNGAFRQLALLNLIKIIKATGRTALHHEAFVVFTAVKIYCGTFPNQNHGKFFTNFYLNFLIRDGGSVGTPSTGVFGTVMSICHHLGNKYGLPRKLGKGDPFDTPLQCLNSCKYTEMMSNSLEEKGTITTQQVNYLKTDWFLWHLLILLFQVFFRPYHT